MREEKVSNKFSVVFPANVELKCFVDDEMRIFAEHPKRSGVYIGVSPMEIYDTVWDKTDWKKK